MVIGQIIINHLIEAGSHALPAKLSKIFRIIERVWRLVKAASFVSYILGRCGRRMADFRNAPAPSRLTTVAINKCPFSECDRAKPDCGPPRDRAKPYTITRSELEFSGRRGEATPRSEVVFFLS